MALDYRKRQAGLSKRELTVLAGMEIGKTARQLSIELGLGIRTVENHRARIFQKLNVRHGHNWFSA